MEKNKQKITWKNILPEILLMLLAALGVYACGFIHHKNTDVILRIIVMCVLGFAVVGFLMRQAYFDGSLSYNNSAHLLRFWVAVAAGLVIALVCAFLPVGGWPFLAIYVMLSLYSNLSVGVLAASVLLMLSTLLGEAQTGVFFLYFVSGVFAAALFRNLEKEFTIGIPWLLSILCLLVCETANIILVANERLSLELFVVPTANIIISSILLTGFLNLFSREVIYQYRERYLEINDTENTVLKEYKEKDRAEYFLCIHTAYFCERIAGRLKMDVDALKCAGYYHKLYKKLKEQEEAFIFPPGAEAILKEYQERKGAVTQKETAVLVCADAVVGAIMLMFDKNKEKQLDYSQVIDAVFKKFRDAGVFQNCNITMQEFNTMQRIFKEEKLYYDFLR